MVLLEKDGRVSFGWTYVLPGDVLALILVLFLSEDELDEQLLQFFVAVIDAQLLETIDEKGHESVAKK